MSMSDPSLVDALSFEPLTPLRFLDRSAAVFADRVAVVDGEVVALAETDPAGGRVDVVVPPPQPSLAVMVENQADARPQTGLTHADVVYEVLAEGGITRFLAVFVDTH